ncbi:MAG TPA: hypothetical protein VHX36_17540 [Candidatus Acidoferrales bacterium]|nr:hypothetical protein [Candidatus Acidoferrales bacterium]
MQRRVNLSIGAPATTAVLLTALAAACFGYPRANPQAAAARPAVRSTPAQAPSAEQIQARAKELIENQHKNDRALDEYERVERHRDFTTGPNPQTIEDKVYRVLPDGGGTMKILLKDNGASTAPAEYRRQLQLWDDILQRMTQSNDSKGKAAREKYEKRQRERSDFVDAAGNAYIVKWLAQETRNGRECDVYDLTPNPAFHPRSMFQSALTHVTAKIWVDHDTNELVRGEAHVLSDISFGGGFLGKLYRGSFVSIEQAQVAPGIWLPTRTEYEFTGRKFLFPFAEHQTIEASHYRRLGSIHDMLAIAQNELATGKTFSEDP